MKESEALEQVLVLLGHAKIQEKYKDSTDNDAIGIAWKLVSKLKAEGN